MCRPVSNICQWDLWYLISELNTKQVIVPVGNCMTAHNLIAVLRKMLKWVCLCYTPFLLALLGRRTTHHWPKQPTSNTLKVMPYQWDLLTCTHKTHTVFNNTKLKVHEKHTTKILQPAVPTPEAFQQLELGAFNRKLITWAGAPHYPITCSA